MVLSMTVKYVTIKSKEIHIHPTKENIALLLMHLFLHSSSFLAGTVKTG